MTTEAEQARSELRDAVRRCLERADGPRPYLVGESGTTETFDAKLWRVLATEVGVTGLLVPEDLGGAGATFADVSVVAGELGGALAPVPFFSTVALATSALLVNRDDDVAKEVLARVAAGTTATLPGQGDSGLAAPGVRAVPDAGAWRLTGELGLVVDGADADVLLVPADTGTGTALFVVEAGAAGVRRAPLRTLDLTRPLAAVTLDGAAAALVGIESGVGVGLTTALDLAIVLLAVEQVGGAQRCLDEAVAYAKDRVQFDRPIGSFQAVKHTLVDVLLAVELARSAAEFAVAAADAYLAAPGPDTAAALAQAASIAKATCSEAYVHTTEETLHVHGGIGFTWEHDAHLHYRRARAGELFLGTPHAHRERLATSAGLS
ncbi:acyl-CoA dehydrogenase family protein [Actinophytocola sp.]|uniref:acyl-CoA dehydrogenase family protein n=1 Tax=Actinophytocola sp. TaxID=1872138 RepID=UPI002EDA81E6